VGFQAGPGRPICLWLDAQGLPWPDEAKTFRSAPPDVLLRLSEPWRTGVPLADSLAPVKPAYVAGSPTRTDKLLVGPVPALDDQPLLADERFRAFYDAVRTPVAPGLGLEGGLRLGNDLASLRMLLFVRNALLNTDILVFRGQDGAGNDTGFELPIDLGSVQPVSQFAHLPAEWIDPAGPWAAPVAAAYNAWDQVYRSRLEGCSLALFEVSLPAGTVQGYFGLREEGHFDRPYWGILIVEGATVGEMLRFSFDDEVQSNKRKDVNRLLTANESKRALLHPNATYEVKATYTVEAAESDEHGNPGKASHPTDPIEQRFPLQDRQPASREAGSLGAGDCAGPGRRVLLLGDPIRVVFSTSAVKRCSPPMALPITS